MMMMSMTMITRRRKRRDDTKHSLYLHSKSFHLIKLIFSNFSFQEFKADNEAVLSPCGSLLMILWYSSLDQCLSLEARQTKSSKQEAAFLFEDNHNQSDWLEGNKT